MRIIEIPLKGNLLDPCLRSASLLENCLHLGELHLINDQGELHLINDQENVLK